MLGLFVKLKLALHLKVQYIWKPNKSNAKLLTLESPQFKRDTAKILHTDIYFFSLILTLLNRQRLVENHYDACIPEWVYYCNSY